MVPASLVILVDSPGHAVKYNVQDLMLEPMNIQVSRGLQSTWVLNEDGMSDMQKTLWDCVKDPESALRSSLPTYGRVITLRVLKQRW